MTGALHFNVKHPNARAVRVDVRVLPLVNKRRLLPDEGEDLVYAIDDDVLGDKKSLYAFLANITRSQGNGAVVHAACFEPDVDRILTILGITGPPPAIIQIDAPDA